MEWFRKNREWFFSGIGVFFLTLIISYFQNKDKIDNWAIVNKDYILGGTILILLVLLVLLVYSKDTKPTNKEDSNKGSNGEKIKGNSKYGTKILFVDDRKFKVVDILIKAGWKNTSIIKDVENLYSEDVMKSDILFIDVDGVGKKLDFKDEGLGLALALKKKYPSKYIVIYSAITEGNRFHEALNKADATLEKDADPFEFIEIVEEFTKKLSK